MPQLAATKAAACKGALHAASPRGRGERGEREARQGRLHGTAKVPGPAGSVRQPGGRDPAHRDRISFFTSSLESGNLLPRPPKWREGL